jgi:mycothiol synthase
VIPGLPSDLHARPAAVDDLEAVAALFLAWDRTLPEEPDRMEDYLEWAWGLSYVDLERDSMSLYDGERLVGFSMVRWDPAQGGPLNGGWCVHPDADFAALAGPLADWMESGIADRPGSEWIRTGASSSDQVSLGFLEARSYRKVRTSWDMARALSSREDFGPPPAGIVVRPFRPGHDELLLYEVLETAFRDHWGYEPEPFASFSSEHYETSTWDPTLALIAEIEGGAVGGLIAYELEGRDYVASVGVLQEFRGRGAAAALLRRIFAEMASRGHRRVELSVDAENPTGAVSLYEGVGMTVLRESFTYEGPSR